MMREEKEEKEEEERKRDRECWSELTPRVGIYSINF